MNSKKLSLLGLLSLAITAQANAHPYDPSAMEKCSVVKNGVGMIKAHKADCNTVNGKNSCAGQNTAGEKEAWIFVPKGQCEKINAGDCSGISTDTRARLENGVCKN
jgi:uncharacterized membrane protein